MILKKQEKDKRIKAIYSSSTICASIYDMTTNGLTVIFKNGSQYFYPNVSPSDYNLFETAESNGAVFNQIKAKYRNHQKLASLDTEAIDVLLKEIKTLSEASQNIFDDKNFLILVNKINGEYIKNGSLPKKMMDDLYDLMNVWKGIIKD